MGDWGEKGNRGTTPKCFWGRKEGARQLSSRLSSGALFLLAKTSKTRQDGSSRHLSLTTSHNIHQWRATVQEVATEGD